MAALSVGARLGNGLLVHVLEARERQGWKRMRPSCGCSESFVLGHAFAWYKLTFKWVGG